jgi:hypothetical protein
MGKSFYDLDYAVELAEKRVEQYTSTYQTILGRLTNIILVYSVFSIYLIPILQDFPRIYSWLFRVATLATFALIAISLFFTMRLIWPVYIYNLEPSRLYFSDLRLQYEKRMIRPEMATNEVDSVRDTINGLLKATYIDELNKIQKNNLDTSVKKDNYYFKAMAWALIAVLPYVVCAGFHIVKKVNLIQ